MREGIVSDAIHGNKSQNARTRALADFKSGKVRVLVATDIAARGIDIDQLPHVINHELPNVPEDYVHRIGRTGRAGAEGEAISLVSGDERAFLKDIQRLLRREIPVVVIPGFEVGSAPSAAELATRAAHPERERPPLAPGNDRGNQQRRRSSAPRSNGNNNNGGGNSRPAARPTAGAADRVAKPRSAHAESAAETPRNNPHSGRRSGFAGPRPRVLRGVIDETHLRW
jgi:ATP-dependent RNA helicase RhlE